MSVGYSAAWMWVFRRVLPYGYIGIELVRSGVLTEQQQYHLFSKFIMFCGSLCTVFIYHILSGATSKGAGVTFMWRKAIPVIAMVVTTFTHNLFNTEALKTVKPSVYIILVAWLLRYVVFDAFIDVIAFTNVLRGKSYVHFALKCAGIFALVHFFFKDSVSVCQIVGGDMVCHCILYSTATFVFLGDLNPFVF